MVFVATGAAAAGGRVAALVRSPSDGGVIGRENERARTRAWSVRLAPPHVLEGYASEVSVAPGEVLRLHVSADRARWYRVEVYRIGWYRGTGGRLVACVPGCRSDHLGAPRRVPPINTETGRLALSWPVSDSIRIGPKWVSGYYVANLVLTRGRLARRGSYVPFVVRASASRRAAILVQAAVNTWQAYNSWGGRSLYWNHTGVGDDHVSFDRPYAPGGAPGSAGPFANLPQAWEFPLARFLERYGYDVAYTTDVDTDRDPAELLRHRLVITAGHDEYWTRAIRDAFERARDSGVSLAFMGANTGYWQMRYGNDRRTIIEYRSAERDPEPDPSLKTLLFRDLVPPRPECALLGVQSGGGKDKTGIGNGDYTAIAAAYTPPDPWFKGTGFRPDSVIPGLVGYEYDTINKQCDTPPLTVLFKFSPPNHPDAEAVRYTARSGARVFSSGSIRFATALDDLTGHADRRVQRFMRNALDDMSRPH